MCRECGGGYYKHTDGGSRFCVPGPESSTTDNKTWPSEACQNVPQTVQAQQSEAAAGSGIGGDDIPVYTMVMVPAPSTATACPQPTTPAAAFQPPIPCGGGFPTGQNWQFGNGNGTLGNGNATLGNYSAAARLSDSFIKQFGSTQHGGGEMLQAGGMLGNGGTLGNCNGMIGSRFHGTATAPVMCPGTPNAPKKMPAQPMGPPPAHLAHHVHVQQMSYSKMHPPTLLHDSNDGQVSHAQQPLPRPKSPYQGNRFGPY